MLTPLAGLDEAGLLAEVRREYNMDTAALTFVPLGEDSWCYRGADLWVSVRQDIAGHVPAAYQAARELRDAGADHVLAPLAGADGRIVRSFGGWPVVVFPYVESTPLHTPPPLAQELDMVVGLLRRVHAAQLTTDLPRETFRLPCGAELGRLLKRIDEGAVGPGPFGAPLVDLVTGHREAIEADRAELIRLGAACAADTTPFVLTHGEPSSANFLRTEAGLILADWGGAAWGPPERDWFRVIHTMGLELGCRPADDHAMWERLRRYLPAGRR
jgi:spectinomycin phosphotransferase